MSATHVDSFMGSQPSPKDQIVVAAVAVLVYDYILTLHLEIQHIWLSKLTYTKVVFLLVRYIPLFSIMFFLKQHVAMDVPESFCRATFSATVWMLQITILLSEGILAIRTWAIWRRNRIVSVGLGVVTVALVVVTCICATKFVSVLQYGPGPYLGFRGCFVVGNIREALFIDYAMICGVQAILLMLMATSAFLLYKSGSSTELSFVIHRDGIIFYVYLLAISLGSVIIIPIVPPEIMTALAGMESVMYSVFVTRTILNIRSTATRTSMGFTTTELHTHYVMQESTLYFATIPSEDRTLS